MNRHPGNSGSQTSPWVSHKGHASVGVSPSSWVCSGWIFLGFLGFLGALGGLGGLASRSPCILQYPVPPTARLRQGPPLPVTPWHLTSSGHEGSRRPSSSRRIARNSSRIWVKSAMGNSRGKDHLGHLTALVRVRHAVPLRITAVRLIQVFLQDSLGPRTPLWLLD